MNVPLEVLAEGPFTAEQVAVAWEPARPAVAPAVQAEIDARWNRYVHAAGGRLFNGAISCLRCFTRTSTGLALTLYPGDYKTFLVTVVRDRAWFAEHAPEALTPALGNSVLLTTADQAIFGIRSANVSAHAGRAHVFGGVIEQLGTPAFPATPAGILAHLEHEIREELGLTRADLAPHPRLLGLFRDTFLAQPELVWHWELTLPVAAITERLDPHEHTHLHVLPPRGRLQADRLAAEDTLLTPIARAAWTRWRA